MARCSTCSADILSPSRFCNSCGAPVNGDGPLTATIATVAIDIPRNPSKQSASNSHRLSSSGLVDEGRFLPGTLLADRYRIIGLIGRGGMGEVYRATDLTLGQPVALKFLPEAMAQDDRSLTRFYTEVRIARQVSHPNVCRVYDIGQLEGIPFLSMEYIDGEDLGSLLRRIGRLPEDKAVDIARHLCAGLAAAHDRGVLHRDLKPANIMIDGRGNVLINDFGLAAIAADVRGADIRSGTPAYMSPEQLAGREVTRKSDIYALGLVLYELFTGKATFRGDSLAELVRLHTEVPPDNPTLHVKSLDPAVERVILRCLDKDPANRPASALAVAAALPGADPLAAALAAGETPSPELVAKSGETEGMALRPALISTAIILIGLIALVFINAPANLLESTNMDLSPPVVSHKAREVLSSLGYTAKPADSVFGLQYVSEFIAWMKDKKNVPDLPQLLAAGRPSPVYYWYRESPRILTNLDFDLRGVPSWDNPPFFQSGMAGVRFDGQGRLVHLYSVPPQLDKTPEQGPMEWSKLFQVAGLDITKFTPVNPEWNPTTNTDARAAWVGTYPEMPSIPLRIEAASWRQKPVYFFMVNPWTVPGRMQDPPMSLSDRLRRVLTFIILGALFLGAPMLAYHNAGKGRCDFKSAWRLGVFAFTVSMLRWLLSAHHVADALAEIDGLLLYIAIAMLQGGILWLLYLALEPFVRRRWPQTLVSWSRILAGHLKDPRVGSDLLIGTTVGVVCTLLISVGRYIQVTKGWSPGYAPDIGHMLGTNRFLADILMRISNSVQVALLLFFVIFGFRAALRKQWLAITVFILLFGVLEGGAEWLVTAISITGYCLLSLTLLRFGLVAFITLMLTQSLLLREAFTLDFSRFYSGASAFTLICVFAMGLYGFYLTMNGRSILKDEILET